MYTYTETLQDQCRCELDEQSSTPEHFFKISRQEIARTQKFFVYYLIGNHEFIKISHHQIACRS